MDNLWKTVGCERGMKWEFDFWDNDRLICNSETHSVLGLSLKMTSPAETFWLFRPESGVSRLPAKDGGKSQKASGAPATTESITRKIRGLTIDISTVRGGQANGWNPAGICYFATVKHFDHFGAADTLPTYTGWCSVGATPSKAVHAAVAVARSNWTTGLSGAPRSIAPGSPGRRGT